jgi:hypothetical protein
MDIEYVGFPGLGFHGKNLCVMFVFVVVSFLFFYLKSVCSKYGTRLKSTIKTHPNIYAWFVTPSLALKYIN